MHSLLCCGIFRVPSQKEIFSHMPIMYKVTLDMADCITIQKNKKYI